MVRSDRRLHVHGLRSLLQVADSDGMLSGRAPDLPGQGFNGEDLGIRLSQNVTFMERQSADSTERAKESIPRKPSVREVDATRVSEDDPPY
jgi:hypothetical protein